MAIIFGLIAGKYFCHHFVLRRLFRLKMFRDESGTWMIMLITTVLIAYCFSKLYNFSLKMFHPDPGLYLINSRIGISFASFMKIAACGTWMGGEFLYCFCPNNSDIFLSRFFHCLDDNGYDASR